MKTINVIVTKHINHDVTISDMRVINAWAVTAGGDAPLDPNEVLKDAWAQVDEKYAGDLSGIDVHLSWNIE